MKDLDAEGMTQLVVTHEMRFARDASDYIVFMEGGHIVEISDEDEIFTNPKDERTRQFLKRFLVMRISSAFLLRLIACRLFAEGGRGCPALGEPIRTATRLMRFSAPMTS